MINTVTCIILGCVCIIAAILVYLFSGEGLLKFYFGKDNISKYDKKTFKIIHSAYILAFGIFAIVFGLSDKVRSSNSFSWILLALVSTWLVLNYTVTKKKPNKD